MSVADARVTIDVLRRHGHGEQALRYWAFFEKRNEPVLNKPPGAAMRDRY